MGDNIFGRGRHKAPARRPKQKKGKALKAPKPFAFGPSRRFEVAFLHPNAKRYPPSVILRIGRRRKSRGQAYVMYWPGDFRKLEKFQKWLKRAVEYVDAQGPCDLKQIMGYREYP
jgi:hypothetical protein